MDMNTDVIINGRHYQINNDIILVNSLNMKNINENVKKTTRAGDMGMSVDIDKQCEHDNNDTYPVITHVLYHLLSLILP